MEKIWKDHPEECGVCGSSCEIYTDKDLEEGFGYDGDPLRCMECGAKGQWNVYDEDEAGGSWDT